eukprot:1478967-Amphidinium_carterae.1
MAETLRHLLCRLATLPSSGSGGSSDDAVSVQEGGLPRHVCFGTIHKVGDLVNDRFRSICGLVLYFVTAVSADYIKELWARRFGL